MGVTISEVYGHTGSDHGVLNDPNVAYVVINKNKVLGMRSVPGLNVDVEEQDEGIRAKITLDEGAVIEKQVHLCFGMLPKEGVQKIDMDVDIGDNSSISILAHCVFPNAVNVQHIMDAVIKVGRNASYSYYERHIHGPDGGVEVYPKAKVDVASGGVFKTEFELVKGRVGLIDIDYDTTCDDNSTLEMTARISGSADDVIKIRETGLLRGEGSRGVLNTKIAVKDNSRAEVYNKMTATAAHARGHVDCKEIVQGNGVATAVPIVEVSHPGAHVTHEAAIGSVDSKQLQTLMARGLDEEEATDLIIQGLLS